MTAAVVVDATGDGDVATFAGCDIEKGRDDGLMQPVTLEFTLDNVAEDAIYCIGDVDDVQFKGQRFLDWCKEQGEAGLLPKNIVSVRLHPTNNKNERQVNATQFNGLDSTKVETMFQADLELRRQIDLLVDSSVSIYPATKTASTLPPAPPPVSERPVVSSVSTTSRQKRWLWASVLRMW